MSTTDPVCDKQGNEVPPDYAPYDSPEDALAEAYSYSGEGDDFSRVQRTQYANAIRWIEQMKEQARTEGFRQATASVREHILDLLPTWTQRKYNGSRSPSQAGEVLARGLRELADELRHGAPSALAATSDDAVEAGAASLYAAFTENAIAEWDDIEESSRDEYRAHFRASIAAAREANHA